MCSPPGIGNAHQPPGISLRSPHGDPGGEPATLPDAVRYTVTAGGGPTDRWRVSVALPPAPEEGPFPVLYLLDGFLIVESAHPLDPTDRALGGFSLGGLMTCWTLLEWPWPVEGQMRVRAFRSLAWWAWRVVMVRNISSPRGVRSTSIEAPMDMTMPWKAWRR